jgi:hypothetical protein
MGLLIEITDDVRFTTTLREWTAIYAALVYFVDNAKNCDSDVDVIKSMLADQSAFMTDSDDLGKIRFANEIEEIARKYSDGDLAMCEIAYIVEKVLRRPTDSFKSYFERAAEKRNIHE